MKKTLLFLSSIAVLASCTNDELFEENVKAPQAKGISFAIQDAATRGKVDTDYSSFFFAEYDRVNIWADNVIHWYGTHMDWTVAPVEYKATRSHGNPFLTGKNSDNILEFYQTYGDPLPNPDDKEARFLIAYPTGQKMSYDGTKKLFKVTPEYDLVSQSMEDNYMNFDSRLLYQYTTYDTNNLEKAGDVYYQGTGECIDVQLSSPLYMLRFQIDDIEKYSEIFGDINSVSVQSTTNPLTYIVANSSYTLKAEDIVNISGTNYIKSTVKPITVYPNVTTEDRIQIPEGGAWYVKQSCKFIDGVYVLTSKSKDIAVGSPNTFVAGTVEYDLYSDSESGITHDLPGEVGDVVSASMTEEAHFDIAQADGSITYVPAVGSNGLDKQVNVYINNTELKNNTEMNAFVLPAVRNNVEEDFVVTYYFDDVTITEPRKVKADFGAGNSGRLKLNIESKFPWIVTLGSGTADRKLIVNTGAIKDILNTGGASIKWTDEYDTDGTVDFTAISEVLINEGVENLTDADWAVLNKLTNATKVTILNQTESLKDVHLMASLKEVYADNVTSVPADAFGTNAANITDLSLAKVTSYKDNKPFAALKNLNLASYNFVQPGEEVADLFFNNDTKLTLKTVNIASCASLAPVFGHERKILFTGYTALTKITVADKCILNPNEFDGCINLEEVNGIVDITNGEYAFHNCYALRTVNINGTEIPDWCFGNDAQNTGVENVLYNDKQVAPTSVGERAFSRNSSIKVMDLKNATELGAFAFNRAINFVGNTDATPVVKIAVETANECIFYNTQVVRIFAKNVKTVDVNAFSSAALKQVKFGTKLDAVDAGAIQAPATPANVDIFVVDNADKPFFTGFASVTKESATAWPW